MSTTRLRHHGMQWSTETHPDRIAATVADLLDSRPSYRPVETDEAADVADAIARHPSSVIRVHAGGVTSAVHNRVGAR